MSDDRCPVCHEPRHECCGRRDCPYCVPGEPTDDCDAAEERAPDPAPVIPPSRIHDPRLRRPL